jgi:hypothetical protein
VSAGSGVTAMLDILADGSASSAPTIAATPVECVTRRTCGIVKGQRCAPPPARSAAFGPPLPLQTSSCGGRRPRPRGHVATTRRARSSRTTPPTARSSVAAPARRLPWSASVCPCEIVGKPSSVGLLRRTGRLSSASRCGEPRSALSAAPDSTRRLRFTHRSGPARPDSGSRPTQLHCCATPPLTPRKRCASRELR